MVSLESYILRSDPLLEFILYQDNFKIISAYNGNHNGNYNYNDLIKVYIIEEEKKILSSILSFVFSIFTSISSSGEIIFNDGVYKTRKRLVIKIKNKHLDILLTNCDIDNTKNLVNYLKPKQN
jgi:hypothetical protein